MAERRRPLTEAEIFGALDAHLAAHGREPTLDELLAALGGGSYRTLTRGRDAWLAARQAATAARIVPVPEAVRILAREMLARLWDLARETSLAGLENERETLAADRARWARQAEEAAGLADRLSDELGQVRAAEAVRDAEWRARLDASNAEAERLAQENARLAGDAAAQKARIAELEPDREALAACQGRLEAEQRRRRDAEAALETVRAELEDERLRVAEAQLRAQQAELRVVEQAARDTAFEEAASSAELDALRERVERLEREPPRQRAARSKKPAREAAPET